MESGTPNPPRHERGNTAAPGARGSALTVVLAAAGTALAATGFAVSLAAGSGALTAGFAVAMVACAAWLGARVAALRR